MPETPRNPPTADGSVKATRMTRDARIAQDRGQATPVDVLSPEKDNSKVLQTATDDVAPQWFIDLMTPLLEKVGRIPEALETLIGKVDRINESLADTEALASRVNRSAATLHNTLIADDGKIVKFRPVSFADGTMPPNDLPELRKATDINRLNAAQGKAYFKGYYPREVVPKNNRERKTKIKLAIGCRLP